MPSPHDTQRMGDLHEQAIAEALGGRKTKASGSKWHDQGDVRDAHDVPFAFCWDGKSTLGKSITVTLDMISKIREQAQGERPGFGLRWYGTGDLKTVLEDWLLVQLADVEELLPAARAWTELEAALGGQVTAARVSELLMNATEARNTIERMQDDLIALRGELAEAEDARDRYKAQYETRVQAGDPLEGRAVPGYVPRLPWTVVHGVRNGSATVHSCIHYDPKGHQHVVKVESVRIDRSPDSLNRPWLMVNDVRVPDGALYQDGLLVALACAADRSIEVG